MCKHMSLKRRESFRFNYMDYIEAFDELFLIFYDDTFFDEIKENRIDFWHKFTNVELRKYLFSAKYLSIYMKSEEQLYFEAIKLIIEDLKKVILEKGGEI